MQVQEVATSSAGHAVYVERPRDEMEPSMDVNLILKGESGEHASDEVSNMELPMKAVREAREEEMSHMKGRTFKVVKSEA